MPIFWGGGRFGTALQRVPVDFFFFGFVMINKLVGCSVIGIGSFSARGQLEYLVLCMRMGLSAVGDGVRWVLTLRSTERPRKSAL